MCRSIKVLRGAEPPATADEVTAAARQFVRKVSGFPKPSKANQEAFDCAVDEIAAATRRLLEHIGSRAPAPSRHSPMPDRHSPNNP